MHYYPDVVLHGCCTKSKQNPLLNVSPGFADPSVESVCTNTLNGDLKPGKGNYICLKNLYVVLIKSFYTFSIYK